MQRFKLSLTWQMILATILGILVGVFFGEDCYVFASFGSAYIMILKITTIPYLVSAIIHGIGQLHQTQALQILKKGLLFIGLAWCINILMIYIGVFLFPQHEGSMTSSYIQTEPVSVDFASLLIPDNIFYALSTNLIPAVVVFSLLVGISLMYIQDKKPLIHLFGSLVDAFTKITQWISRITPIGTFLIIANQAGTIQLTTVKQVSTYVILFILILNTIVFWIFPRIIASITKTSALQWIKDLFPILLLAYTTNVVIVCLPFIIELIKKELEKSHRIDEKTQSQIQGIVSITFNLPLGSLFITLFVFFIAVLYGIPLLPTGQFQLFISAFLTSLGSIGLGAWINSLNFILEILGLPLDAVNVYLTTQPFTSGFQAMTSVMEIASLSFLITSACHKLLVFKFGRLIRKMSFTLGPILLVAILLKQYNPLPKIENLTLSIFDLEQKDSPTLETPSTREYATEDPLQRILKSKILRVGINTQALPFCFINHFDQIAGYDITIAKELAFDLGVRLVVVPMAYDHIAEELAKGSFDIAMSAVSITEERLPFLYFSKPYLEGKICFIVKDKQRKMLSHEYALENHTELSIAVLKGSAYECMARNLFPHHRLIVLEDLDNFSQSSADVLLWTEKQAIPWILRYPHYSIVYPNPSLGTDLFAYAVPQGADLLLNYINIWLSLKKAEGFTDHQYDLWVLGKTGQAVSDTPRWSILHNILQKKAP